MQLATVSNQELLRLGSEAAQQEQYGGGVKIDFFTNVDEAIKSAKQKLREESD